MRKHNGMRPQDIVILLKMMTFKNNNNWTFLEIANALQISEGEVSMSMGRNRIAGLVNPAKNLVNKLALREFLIYGIKYVFPPQVGSSVRGIATAHSAPPINQQIVGDKEIYVWSYYKGTRKGNSIVPLYDKIPKIVGNEPELYEYLTIIDTLRIGKTREIEIAIKELDKRLNEYVGKY
jgi:hypothetical protein